TVSLRKGKVAVKRTDTQESHAPVFILKPGEEATYREGQLLKSRFIRKERLSWKEQVLYFRDAGLEEVVRKLERYYGVRFDCRDLENTSWKLTGEYRQQSLGDVLESLSFNYGIKYEISGNQVKLQK
ncbi:MAG TPA: DUF4974 domain-containing protein, partial [Anseongella sp.]|nr:DUF4974 domain-containing protein [Anseongella sp.]